MKIRKIICFIDIDALFYRPEQYKQSKQLYHSFSSFLIIYNPQIQKSGETKTKGSKSGKNRGKSQFQAVIEI